MPRIVKGYDERYSEFLDAAERLFFSKGYEPTSVQEIIKVVGVAKGTFYHYFDSKADILSALVNRMADGILATLNAMIADPDLSAIEKLQRYIGLIYRWKVDHREAVIAMVRILYRDESVLLREKMRDESYRRVLPVLTAIIQQGMDEGTFAVEHPEQTAELVLILPQTMNETISRFLLVGEWDEAAVEHVRRQVVVLNRSLQRVLGMADHSVTFVDPAIADDWL